jgi:hypothetical protein
MQAGVAGRRAHRAASRESPETRALCSRADRALHCARSRDNDFDTCGPRGLSRWNGRGLPSSHRWSRACLGPANRLPGIPSSCRNGRGLYPLLVA